MSNQTLQRAPKQRTRGGQSAREASAKATRASAAAKRSRVKQTARIEGLRDGKPLIFGWGGHLTRAQKARYQRMAAWIFMVVVALAVVATLVFGVLNEQIFIPNQSVVKVNGVSITQDAYRKELAYQAQVLWNPLQVEIAQNDALQAKVTSGDTKAATQDNAILTQLQTNEANYQQAQITQATINTLIENQLILNGAKQFEQQHVPASTFEPSQQAVNTALAAFKKAFPKGETYASFLSSNNLSNSDVINSITIQLRRDKMQAFLAKQLVSPTRQVELRKIETDTKAHAASIRSQLVKGGLTDAIWTSLAKKDSLDPNAKDSGGNLGWVPPGTGDAAIELWAYAAGRKAGDLSPVLADTSGTYDIVQVIAIDPSRTVPANTLQSAQGNALSHWLGGQRAAPSNTVGSPDSTMLNAARNLPKTPSLSATLPSITPPPGSGLPGSSLPSGSIPGAGTGG